SLRGNTFVYDPLRGRVVVFGGLGPIPTTPASNTTWAFTFGDTATWDTLACGGTRPPGSAYHGAIYDPRNDQMVVYGGEHYSSGGFECNAYPAPGTWALSLSTNTWTQLAPTAPGMSQAYTYDSLRGRIVEFGGIQICQGYDGVTRAFDLGSNSGWTEIAPPAAPSATVTVGLLDSNHQEFVVIQGDQVWRMSLNSPGEWTYIPTVGGGSKALKSRDAISEEGIYDPVLDRILVFRGGMVWSLSSSNPAEWTQVIPVPADLGWGYTATYDPSQNRVIAIGSSTEVLNLAPEPSWSLAISTDAMPIKRSGHSAVYDPARYRIIVFGGSDESNIEQNDTWSLALDTFVWTQLSP